MGFSASIQMVKRYKTKTKNIRLLLQLEIYIRRIKLLNNEVNLISASYQLWDI